jgi:hypothetical protein
MSAVLYQDVQTPICSSFVNERARLTSQHFARIHATGQTVTERDARRAAATTLERSIVLGSAQSVAREALQRQPGH